MYYIWELWQFYGILGISFFSKSTKFKVDLQRDSKINWDQIFICIGDLHFICLAKTYRPKTKIQNREIPKFKNET